MRTQLAVVGLGNVGRRFIELIERKREFLRLRYGLELVVTAAADSNGAAIAPDGLDLPAVLELKRSQQSIAAYPKVGRSNLTAAQLAHQAPADILVELSPTNLKHGEPGLSTIRAALERHIHVVTANKGPLVLAYQELTQLAAAQRVKLLHSATITGGLPTLNIGRRDLAPTQILKFEGIVNATTNYILSRMAEGESFDAALKHAQDVGHAEADPTLDVDGWDAANKLTLIANAVLGRPTQLSDLQVEGIRGISQQDLDSARANGEVIKLIARAVLKNGDYELTVRPTRLAQSHPLAGITADMMGVIYETDINGTIFAAIEEKDPYPTAAAVLRDVVAVMASR